jgi:formylglycine-generating enzyme required for sulfatase activity
VRKLPHNPLPTPPITWDIDKLGSPYPGLLHFTRAYGPVFFGRELEVGEVLDRLRQPENRFLLISGASGSGKSSLVDAGVLPKIENGALSSDRPYTCMRIVPSQGTHLFDALVRPLHAFIERAGLAAFELAESLLNEPQSLSEQLQRIMAKGLAGTRLVIFLDQMEELFTVRDRAQVRPFLSGLYQVAFKEDMQVIATIRSDFLPYCYEYPDILNVIKGTGHLPLGPPDAISIREMIRQPARCAGLTISDKLVRKMAQEAGAEPGSLPLLAFALQQLFDRRSDNELTERAYEQEMGGLTGAIRLHAEKVEKGIIDVAKAPPEEALPKVFGPLVVMTNEGQPTRKRVRKDTYDVQWLPVVNLLIKGRLLQGEGGEQAESLVSIAHEKLFQAWPSLAKWVTDNQQDLFTLRQAEMQAGEWERHGYDPKYLWHVDRHRTLPGIIARFGEQTIKEESGTKRIHQFAAPQKRLIERLKDSTLSHHERLTIGQYLAGLDDPRPGVGMKNRLPDIEWVKIPGGKIQLEGVGHVFAVKPFLMAKYPVTNAQFQAFIEDGGYEHEEWWQGIKKVEPQPSAWQEPNAPRETVSWFEAVAFCNWLSARTRTRIRLPTEWEWQQAATSGNPANDYPWGKDWDAARCNSTESRLNRTTPVGLYPLGATLQGTMDMAGNVREWCLNTFDNPETPESVRLDDDSKNWRVLRGGSWLNLPEFLRTSLRFRYLPGSRANLIGFRLAQDTP